MPWKRLARTCEGPSVTAIMKEASSRRQISNSRRVRRGIDPPSCSIHKAKHLSLAGKDRPVWCFSRSDAVTCNASRMTSSTLCSIQMEQRLQEIARQYHNIPQNIKEV